MDSQRCLQSVCGLVTLLAVLAAGACSGEDQKEVKGRTGPNGGTHDSVSQVPLNEDGIGPIQVGMDLADAVNMGILNENPTMKKECDFVFPAVGAGVPDNIGVMIVRGQVARIDVDTGSATTEDGATTGVPEGRIKRR